MNIKNTVIGLVALAVLGLGISAVVHKEVSTPSTQSVRTGSLSGPDITSPYLAVNGLRHEYRSQYPLTTGSTTVCALLSPSATSTLIFAGARISTSTSTATTWTAAKATSAFATTTGLGTFSLSSGVQGTLVASSTQISGTTVGVDPVQVFAPNTWLVWGVAGVINAAIPSTNFGGGCSAEFLVY